jgi:hypothetical protein
MLEVSTTSFQPPERPPLIAPQDLRGFQNLGGLQKLALLSFALSKGDRLLEIGLSKKHSYRMSIVGLIQR